MARQSLFLGSQRVLHLLVWIWLWGGLAGYRFLGRAHCQLMSGFDFG